MTTWKKLKKYFMADLTPERPSFSLGTWEDSFTPTVSPATASTPTVSMPQISNTLDNQGILSQDLDVNLDWFKQQFSFPQNHGLVIRKLAIGHSSYHAAVIYMEGQVNWNHLNQTVLTPLISMDIPPEMEVTVDMLLDGIVSESQVSTENQLKTIVNKILMGSAAIIVDGLHVSILASIKGWEKRAIENPRTETVVRGSLEGFTEDIETNLSMIRRRIRTPDLMIEWGQVGTLSRTEIAIIYIKSIANEEIVNEVRRRIAAIQYDYIGDSGTIEQFIEDSPNSFYPSVLSTERPDRVAAQISEGFVGIIVNNSPFGLIVPAQFPLFLQTTEDANLRWPYSTFLRMIRTVGFFLSLYLPAIYVGVANYHQEMIPTTLLLAISSTRETVPIPVAAETFMLECMFELIREAGVRIPSVIGPTIGIVGALILGQAAVQANIVSPIVVIITATTALSSYTIPNYNMQFATRILRFVYLIAASLFGLVGVVLVSVSLLSIRISSNTFGVPILSPLSPHHTSKDLLIRDPIDRQTKRPVSIRPKRLYKTPTDRE